MPRPIRKWTQPRLTAKRDAQITRVVETGLLRDLTDGDLALREQMLRPCDALLHDLAVRRLSKQALNFSSKRVRDIGTARNTSPTSTPAHACCLINFNAAATFASATATTSVDCRSTTRTGCT